MFFKMSNALGSPPRMRGTDENAPASRETLRITPADAGNSASRVTHAAMLKDHPRGCGEQ